VTVHHIRQNIMPSKARRKSKLARNYGDGVDGPCYGIAVPR
jgi:hypothetical protein